MQIPAVILVREGSKRLPQKWALPWMGTTLVRWACAQVLQCEHVSGLVLATDSQAIIDNVHGVKPAMGSMEVFKDSVSATLARHWSRFESIKRPPVPDEQTSLSGLRWVQDALGLTASYVMLCQATSPFINPEDLSRLVLCADLPCRSFVALGARQRPTGQGYIVPPFITDATVKAWVEQDAPDVDVDTQSDYERALTLCQR